MVVKKTWVLGLISLGLAACASVAEPTQTGHDSASQAQKAQTQVIHFIGPYDLTLELTSNDGFQTAILVDNSGRQHLLQQAISASGVRLVGPDGVSIHFKNFTGLNEGTVELVKGRPIAIQEFQAASNTD